MIVKGIGLECPDTGILIDNYGRASIRHAVPQDVPEIEHVVRETEECFLRTGRSIEVIEMLTDDRIPSFKRDPESMFFLMCEGQDASILGVANGGLNIEGGGELKFGYSDIILNTSGVKDVGKHLLVATVRALFSYQELDRVAAEWVQNRDKSRDMLGLYGFDVIGRHFRAYLSRDTYETSGIYAFP